MSTRMTFSPSFAAKAARFRAVVVLPDPPLPDPRTSHLARFGMAGRASLDFWAAITPSAAPALSIILNPLPHRPSGAFAGDIGNPAARKRNCEMASRDAYASKVANSPHLASRIRQLGARPGDVRTGSACGTGGDSLDGMMKSFRPWKVDEVWPRAEPNAGAGTPGVRPHHMARNMGWAQCAHTADPC